MHLLGMFRPRSEHQHAQTLTAGKDKSSMLVRMRILFACCREPTCLGELHQAAVMELL